MIAGRNVLQRRCSGADLALPADPKWVTGEARLAHRRRRDAIDYLVAMPGAALVAESLTGLLGRVAPFGCPQPGSLIRAYSLPDSPYPSILLGEHEGAPDGVGEAYGRFLLASRREWLEALQGTGPGLCPVVAWRGGSARRFLTHPERAGLLEEAGIAVSGVADGYLGRALILLDEPDI